MGKLLRCWALAPMVMCAACGGSDGAGSRGVGGASTGGVGGTSDVGGVPGVGGTTGSGGAGAIAGVGGEGGVPAAGGASTTGGAPATGGAATGGTPNTGGASTGGTSTGGTSTGGTSTGGTSTGGTSTGGTSTGGTSTGGTSTGGTTACDWSDPPSNVAAWIDESWNAQLGNNIRTRSAWLLDNVMAEQGTLSLCVRWGATSAVPDTVRTNLASTIQRWFNDWFRGLGSYGCFPYGSGITVRVGGWAVRPGQQALLGAIDPSIPVYTETDSSGEPKCPDACSSFVHWDHQFTNCPGGAANHTDYWLWFDDTLPGGGGAAAVGGDWGLRMPVSTFTQHFGDTSFMIVEHEMGHGFGFQDYYTWAGSQPAGGSIMIVGSTRSQSPTTGDIWLLRRTWKEMVALRGW